jgi:hypothetical protein
VPYDIAFGLGEAERIAYVVKFGNLDGQEFDWKAVRWIDTATEFDK